MPANLIPNKLNRNVFFILVSWNILRMFCLDSWNLLGILSVPSCESMLLSALLLVTLLFAQHNSCIILFDIWFENLTIVSVNLDAFFKKLIIYISKQKISCSRILLALAYLSWLWIDSGDRPRLVTCQCLFHLAWAWKAFSFSCPFEAAWPRGGSS